jgi:hypothetical protein
MALPALDEALAAEQEAAALQDALVRGLLILHGQAQLAAKYAELTAYVHHACGVRVSAFELDNLLDEEKLELEERARCTAQAHMQSLPCTALRHATPLLLTSMYKSTCVSWTLWSPLALPSLQLLDGGAAETAASAGIS